MYQIDNDYMINERALDVRANLKLKNNASNIAEIFFKQLALRMYDFVMRNSINFASREKVDEYLAYNQDWIEDFKRAQAEQALYMLSNGDLSLMLPDGTIDYATWQKMRVSPATMDILRQLGLLRTVVSEQELYAKSLQSQFNPHRNW